MRTSCRKTPQTPASWREVTPVVSAARECLRSLWNQHYRPLTRQADSFDAVDAYKVTCKRILSDFLALADAARAGLFVSIRKDVPPSVVYRQNRAVTDYVSWEPLETATLFHNKRLRFIDFYDFDQRGLIDLRHVDLKASGKTRLLAEFCHCRFWVRMER